VEGNSVSVRNGAHLRNLSHGRFGSARLWAFRCSPGAACCAARSRAGAPWRQPPRNRHGPCLRYAILCKLRRHQRGTNTLQQVSRDHLASFTADSDARYAKELGNFRWCSRRSFQAFPLHGRYVAGYSPPAGRRWRGERSGSWSKVRAHSKGQLLNSRCFSRRPAAIPSGLSAGRRPASSRPAGSSRSRPWSRTRPSASRRGPGRRLLPAAAHSLRFGRSIFFLQSARLVRASSLAGSIATAFSRNVRASFSLPASKSEYPRSFASS
jgi:hypothetical protein